MIKLYSYFRSSAAYRVRIALNLKGLPYQYHSVHLLRAGGEQHQPDYAQLNPQELVPTLVDGEVVLSQSLAIIEYLDEVYQGGSALLPADAQQRADARALAQLIACDIHPLNNLRVLQYLQDELQISKETVRQWYAHWVHLGFEAFEQHLSRTAPAPFCVGDEPSIADCCLVPQLYNARRFDLDLSAYTNILRVVANCQDLAAFQEAVPEKQPDAA